MSSNFGDRRSPVVFDSLEPTYDSVGQSGEMMLREVSQIWPVVRAPSDPDLASTLTEMKDAMLMMSNQLKALQEYMEHDNLSYKLGQAYKGAKEGVRGVYDNVAKYLRDHKVAEKLGIPFVKLRDAFVDLGTKISDAYGKIKDSFTKEGGKGKQFVDAVKRVMGSVGTALKNFWNATFGKVIEKVEEKYPAVKQAFNRAINTIDKHVIFPATEKIIETAQKAADHVRTASHAINDVRYAGAVETVARGLKKDTMEEAKAVVRDAISAGRKDAQKKLVESRKREKQNRADKAVNRISRRDNGIREL